MKKNTFNILFICFAFFSFSLSAQSDEDTGSYTTCNSDGENASRTSNDLPNAVNVGTIDDRSCYANYKESNINGITWGIYNITDGSNKFDATLQPRIERSLPRSQSIVPGSYARFTGTVRILEVGDTSGTSNDGSYIMQAKGKHTGGGGSADPAICLYLAKPVYGTVNGKQVQVSFNIYREQINVRGGSGGSERNEVFLINVKKNVATDIELEVGFIEDPNDSSKTIHYADAVIGGTVFNWNIPEPERGTESGIRYGAYRVKGGRAQIRWANTTYQKVEKDGSEVIVPSDDIYRLRNVATGKFLTDLGASAQPVTMTDSGETQNTHWSFVQSGDFINIDSESLGILRATGSGFAAGPYAVVSTTKASPASDSDKVWTLHQDETTEIYRFQAGTSGRYLYNEENGNVTNITATETDKRSQWEAIPTSQSLSTKDNELTLASVKVYPNPTNNNFTIALKNITIANVKIYNTLGKAVYQGFTINGKIEFKNNAQLSSGLYLVKVIADDNKVYNSKLLVR